jgi:hypothetical protein
MVLPASPSYSPTNSLPVLPLLPSQIPIPNWHTLQSGTRAGQFDSGGRKQPPGNPPPLHGQSPVPTRSARRCGRARANGAGGGSGVARGDPRVVGAALPQHQPHVLLRPGRSATLLLLPPLLLCSRLDAFPRARDGGSQTDGNPFRRTRVRSAATQARSRCSDRRGLVVGGSRPMRATRVLR